MSGFRRLSVHFLFLVPVIVLPLQGGLIITPSFDTSITSDKNATAIEATINSVLNTYEADFLDPIHVYITFQEMASGLGQSDFDLYQYKYSDIHAHLAADAKSPDDATALAHLPGGMANPVTGTDLMLIKSANAKALGFSPIADGVSDGTVSFNPQVTDPGSGVTTGDYSLAVVMEHEIDEILGLGSTLGTESDLPLSNEPSPEDLFRYDNLGNRSYTTDPGQYAVFFSLDGQTHLAQFNNSGAGDYGDWLTGASVAQVQDAVSPAHLNPVLGAELRALDVIGYDRNVVPEPSSVLLFASGLFTVALAARAGKQRFSHTLSPGAEQKTFDRSDVENA